MQHMTTASGRLERDNQAIHDWRVCQLNRLGLTKSLAEAYADAIDWHQFAELVRKGCPPLLALRIVG